MFDWLFGTKQKVYKAPILPIETKRLQQALWQSKYLPTSINEKIIRWCRVFIRDKNWEGCNGLRLNDEMKWTIAAAAGLMVVRYDDWYFDKTQTILVYPTPYIARVENRFGGMTDTLPSIMGEYPRAGETIYRGPVIVNWQDSAISASNSNAGHHLIIHEFSHQLDMINGPSADGLPPLPDDIDETRWLANLKNEFDEARRMTESGYRVLLDHYGLTKISEFFAVASEYYFQVPHLLATYHPNVFELLKLFYQIDLREHLPREEEN